MSKLFVIDVGGTDGRGALLVEKEKKKEVKVKVAPFAFLKSGINNQNSKGKSLTGLSLPQLVPAMETIFQ